MARLDMVKSMGGAAGSLAVLRLVLRKPDLIGAAFASIAALLLCVVPTTAQESPSARLVERLPEAALAPLPVARESEHTLALPNRELRFKATAAALAIGNTDRTVLADVAYLSYVAGKGDPARRPVVFAFNGGPGSASTWLHLGAMGPWRVDLSGETIASRATPALIPNAETWLDFADLVFIDPPSTGFSAIWTGSQGEPPASGIYLSPVPPAAQRDAHRDRRGRPTQAMRATSGRQLGGTDWFWSVDGDIVTFTDVIAAWIERNGRKASPIVLVGESYGGFRAPLIAEQLASTHGLTVSGMVLVSPVLDFDGRRGWRTPMSYVSLLPSIAAVAQERSGTAPSRSSLADVERYAQGEYLRDLVRGPRDASAVSRMAARVAQASRMPADVVQRLGGRLSARSFIQHSPQLAGRVVSIYDAGMSDLPMPRSAGRGGFQDAFTSGLSEPLAAAMDVVYERLGWRPDRRYLTLSGEVNRRWRWPNGPNAPEVLGTLDELHRGSPGLRTLVVHGFTDLVTPYFATQLQLEQLPPHGTEHRISTEVYAGGHMFYSRDASRVRFRLDAERVIAEATGAQKKPSGDQRETP